MKLYYLLLPLLLFACKTKTGTLTPENTIMENSANRTHCPEEGSCSTVVYPNHELKIVDDGSGRLYSQMETGKGIVVKFTYFRPGPEGTADGNYTENIQFEVPSYATDLIVENEDLATVKMVFEKFGFRNAASYRVSKGKLSYRKTGKKIVFSVDFELDQDTNEISRIQETVMLQ